MKKHTEEMVNNLFEDGICIGFDYKCENEGDCGNCKLLNEYTELNNREWKDINNKINEMNFVYNNLKVVQDKDTK
jgi:hypothetical protein